MQRSPLLSEPLSPFTAYPLSLLSPDAREELLSIVSSCPSMVLEGAYRLALDAMLVEVKAGASSCGSRLMLRAIVESEGGEVCGAVVERVSVVCDGVMV